MRRLRDAKPIQVLLHLLAFVAFPATTQAELSIPGVTASPASIMASPSASSSSTYCPLTFVESCLSVAIINVCGNINETSCVCGTKGQGSIATAAAPCLLSSCSYDFLISLATGAGTFCNQWISTHTLTGSDLLSAQSAINASLTTSHPSASFFPISTTNGSLSTTISPTSSRPSDISSDTSTPAPAGLPLGAGVGIGVGAFAILSGVVVGIILCRRHKQRVARARAADAGQGEHDHEHGDYELATEANAHELADKRQRMSAIGIPPQELEGFQFPFQQSPVEPVEADSRSVRAGQPRGRMAGTETTAFDFETQKVLLTPVFVRTPGSRAASVSTNESGSRRAQRPGTAASG